MQILLNRRAESGGRRLDAGALFPLLSAKEFRKESYAGATIDPSN
jgi:hypothetical protein